MRHSNLALVSIIFVGLASNTLHAERYTVVVKSNPDQFVPADITISESDHIVWAWVSGAHTVTSDNYSPSDPTTFDSGIKVAPARMRRIFNVAGDYPYYCFLHGSPGGIGHAGIIRVNTRNWDDGDEEEPIPLPSKVKHR